MTNQDDCGNPGNGPDGAEAAAGAGAPGGSDRPGDLAGHIVGCDPCGESLDSLQAQGNALKYLATDGEGGDVAVVERVLSESARAGRQKLADLLYELAKACLVMHSQEAARHHQWVSPRSIESVVDKIGRLADRGIDASHTDSIRHLANGVERIDAAINAADNCLGLLRQVEGGSGRQTLGVAQARYQQGNYSEAISIYEGVLNQPHPDEIRGMAQANLICMLNRQGEFESAAKIGANLIECPASSFMAGFNYAVALAYLGRAREFESVARQLAIEIRKPGGDWKARLVDTDVESLSQRLEESEPVVREWFGIDRTDATLS